MIEGVKIKELKEITDDRGFLMEFLRCDDNVFDKFGQVYMTGCKRGVAKAWHYHKEQDDHFVCVWGKSLVILYDNRQNSPTFGEVNEFILESPPTKDKKSVLLKIPHLVIHGFAAFDCDESRIVNIPTLPYRNDRPDEFRMPWNSKEVPYSWPDFISTGG